MRVLFVSHYFHPEVGAPQTRILEAAQRLSSRGHEVSVLTGFPNYPDGVIPEPYRGHRLLRERLGPLRVIRSAVYPAPNRGFGRRLLNHASFAVSSVLVAPLARRPDVVIAETPPLFTAAAGVAIARGRGAPLILNVADLWPDSAVALGALSNPRAIALAQWLERFAYRHSAAITVPTAGIRTTLIERGIPEDRVIHLPNAVDVERFAALEPPGEPLRRVIYCGTVGLAQGVGTLIDAATELRRGGLDLEFLIVGDGAERAELADRARSSRLDNVRFLGRVDRDRVPELLGDSDIAVLSLRDLPLFEDALPSKLLEYMAAARPVVASAAGDVARLLDRAQAGLAARPGDATALAESIRQLAEEPSRARELGASGRRYVSAHYSREAFVDRLEEIMRRVAGEDRERARVRRVYARYATSPARMRAWNPRNPGNERIIATLYGQLRARLVEAGCWPGPGSVLLDVGCGSGEFLAWLVERGAPPESLIGVDVLEERVADARGRVPNARIDLADARELPVAEASVNAVVFLTLLSSVTDPSDRRRIAAEAMRVLRPGGVILCYDLRWPSPRNPNVRAITRRELRRLFDGAAIGTRSLTLLPPLARRLGSLTEQLYGPLASVPVLRTHLLAAVRP